MKSLADPPVSAAYEPDFLLRLDTAEGRGQWKRSAVISIAVHMAATALLINVDFISSPPRPRMFPEVTIRRVTPLVVPPDVLKEFTQKAPNTKQVAKEFDLQSLLPRPEVKKTPAQPAVAPKPSPGAPAPSTLPAAPQFSAAPTQQVAQLPPQGLGNTNQPPPPPQIETAEKPKLTLENIPGTGRGAGNTAGGTSAPRVAIPIPKNTVEDAVARVRTRPGGGLIVGDDADPQPSIGESLGQRAVPGKMGSTLELLSDPQGADFRPYLIKVLAAVRRNWFAVIPESARLGRAGKVVIQFAISRNGGVPKLIISVPSGAEPLDRAAVAGISASNPFPPLPTEFRGDQVRLQLQFVYNGR